MIAYQLDEDGCALITWDMPDRTANVLNDASMAAFAEAIDRAIADPNVKGIVIASGKDDFIAGADLAMLRRLADGDLDPPEVFYAKALEGDGFNAVLRRMETAGKPVVAAINGTALGGGFEICLACHQRVVADSEHIQLGLPEATLGLLPAGGGTQRLGRLVGWRKAADLLLSGKRLRPRDALDAGIIDDIAPASALVDVAKNWIAANPTAAQPWDKKGYRLPGGGFYEPAGQADMTALITRVHGSTQGNAPAPIAILRCLHDGLRASFNAGLRVECREFYGLLKHPSSSAMIRSLFFNMQRANKLERRPKDVERKTFRKVGVLGAGMMGAGIALSSAQAGLDVVLLDMTAETADKGKAYSEKVLSKSVSRGKISEAEKRDVLKRISPTTAYEDLADCDIIIEAVFEDRAIKANVTKKAEAVTSGDTIFGSNTSTLPITGLAENAGRPDRFIGVHFFSPVERMPLVELICGEATSDKTLAETLDFVRRISKTPIIVNDARGFYTSRVFGTYTREGAEMLKEGVPAPVIENLGRASGMPVPPLALLDEISLDLVYSVRKQTAEDLGDAFERTSIDDIAENMVNAHDRKGRKSGSGFYDYSSNGKVLWKDLDKHYPASSAEQDYEEIKKRFLYIQAIETARCVEEDVITDAGDADIGAILGWGFPAHTGGPLSLIDAVGVQTFVDECRSLAQKYGPRFSPPQLLIDMADKGTAFHS